MTNTLQDLLLPCREGCGMTATVVRKRDKNDNEVVPVFATCGVCSPRTLTEQEQKMAIEHYSIETPTEESEDSERAQAIAELHERLGTKRTDGDQVRYYSAPRKPRARTA